MSAVELCVGDCLDVLLRLEPRRFSFVLTDPPYSRAGAAHSARSNASGKHSELSGADAFWGHWFRDVWSAVARVCKEDACAMVFTDYRTVGALEKAVAQSGTGWTVSQCAVWDRGGIGLGSPLRARYEMIAFLRGPDFKWDGPRDVANLFQCAWPYGEKKYHPSEKPVPLLKTLASMFARGGEVLDPFTGSGSALLACREIGVGALGIEADHDTCCVAARRLGKSVTLFSDTILRKDGAGQLWLMNKPDKGWSSFAIPVGSEAHVSVFYNATVGPWQSDADGPFASVTRRNQVAA